MDRPKPMLLTRDAAAEALSISEKTIRRMTDKGQLPFVRVGGRGVRYAVRDLEAFIASNTIAVTPPAKQGG